MQKLESKEGFFPQLPVTRAAVELFGFSPERISQRNILFFEEYREFRAAAYHINIKRSFDKAVNKDVHYAKPSDLNAAGLLNAIYKKVFTYFESVIEPDFRKKLISSLETSFSSQKLTYLTSQIEEVFPYELNLHGNNKNADIIVRSLLIRLNNENNALKSYSDLFSDKGLMNNPDFKKMITAIESASSAFGKPEGSTLSILDFLREPFTKFPDSLYDQLNFIKTHWSVYIGDILDNLLLALDFLKEENKPVFNGFGPPEPPDLGLLNDEFEAFTDDSAWMPNVIMLAKSTLVWLDQLSKKYRQPIIRLNQIPDKELDLIASRGFNSLWLIGIWQRSKASKRIKHIYGNFDAEASAYSLNDYEIADSLGGWQALQELRKRCDERGIRLASDMVPNHTAIDSRWVNEHPEWFLQLPYNPMPQYTFNGEDLSDQDDIGIYLEDKYYSKSDCAVVFKRKNHNTGEERYIYHGNDGTGLPWNDTAQLDYLNPETREAIIQTILHVARNFNIIRFDAAMTLAKKHIQRLWYPAPGQGGDIPTRAEHALTTEDFNKAIPIEFWREVVDRIAIESPDTLLLAEAFWMLEGYFVRTLGMHRVYNSAFMHMLRDEDNDKYRHLIKETLEFDPQILKRYVNFMNNPDEETAAEQFGKGDKYFGISMLLCTLPGLPMIGHGQVEGFHEKYGMEFKAAQWNEKEDEYLVKRHNEEIFPIMHKRPLFSEVENFRLYNFTDAHNNVNENVYAYTNRKDDENVLVLFNNCFNSSSGTIMDGVPFKIKSDDKIIVPSFSDFIKSVAPAPLECQDDQLYLIFTEFKSKLDYIRPYRQIEHFGIYCLLNGYEYQIFENFKAIEDVDGSLTQMAEILNGSGIEDIFFEAEMLKYKTVHTAISVILNNEALNLLQDIYKGEDPEIFNQWIESKQKEFLASADHAKDFHDFRKHKKKIFTEMATQLKETALLISEAGNVIDESGFSPLEFINREIAISPETIMILFSWTVISSLKDLNNTYPVELALDKLVRVTFSRSGSPRSDWEKSTHAASILQACSSKQNSLKELLLVQEVQQFLKINEWDDVMWFNIEPFEQLLSWIYLDEIISCRKTGNNTENQRQIALEFSRRHSALLKSDYRLSSFLANIKG